MKIIPQQAAGVTGSIQADGMDFSFMMGTHLPSWLARPEMVGIPLFVSRHRLHSYKTLPAAVTDWALDSGGFTELDTHGKWTISPSRYVAEVRRFQAEVGRMKWAAIQDWMCEPHILANTGLTVQEHQERTIASYLMLREAAPEVPWLPVVQGWRQTDYMRHVEMYAKAGVDLAALPIVGVGSVCRRQNTTEAEWIVRQLAFDCGLRLHGFGFKTLGLERAADVLVSADSLAWSYAARNDAPLPQCAIAGRHKNCANCIDYALMWRERLLERLAHPQCYKMPSLFGKTHGMEFDA